MLTHFQVVRKVLYIEYMYFEFIHTHTYTIPSLVPSLVPRLLSRDTYLFDYDGTSEAVGTLHRSILTLFLMFPGNKDISPWQPTKTCLHGNQHTSSSVS